MISSNPYPKNNLIEESLTGNRHSALALARSICLSSDSEGLSSELETRLGNLQSTDHPIYVTCCQSLLQARNLETYSLAKKTLKASLNETSQDLVFAKLMLIYIKVFSPKNTKIPNITEKFLKEIENVKQTGDCFSEIEIKEEFLEYLLNYSLNPDEVEKGLQLQVALLYDLDVMKNSSAFNVEDLIDRQLKRYLKLIIKYFGGIEIDEDQELEVKKTLEIARANSFLNDHQRKLADYHLANILLRDEFPKTCDIPEGYYLLRNLLKKLDKDNPYHLSVKFIIANNPFDIKAYQISLATMIIHKNPSELKAVILFKLGSSYLKGTFDTDIEKAWIYLNQALECAHPSSFLIPIIRLKLGAVFLLRKKDQRNQDHEEMKKHFDILTNEKNFTKSFKNKVNFLSETTSNLIKNDSEITFQDNINMVDEFLAIAGEDLNEIFKFSVGFKKSSLENEDLCKINIIEKAKSRFKEILNAKEPINFSDLGNAIHTYLSQCEKSDIAYLYKKLSHLQIDTKEVKRTTSNSSLKIDYEIQYKKFAKNLYQLFLSLEDHQKIQVCHFIDDIIEINLKKLQQLSFPIWSKEKALGIQLGIHNYFIELLKKDKNTNRQAILNARISLLRSMNSIKVDAANPDTTQEGLIFLINFYNFENKQIRSLGLPSNDRKLASCYSVLSDFFRGHTKSDLRFEAGRLWYYYHSHLDSFGSKLDIAHNYHFWEKRAAIGELAFVQLHLDAFLCAKDDDVKKYQCIGLELLNFGPKLILDYIEEHHSYKDKFQKSTIPGSLLSLFLTCVELLRFHNREEEANHLLDKFQTLPNLDSYLTSIFKPQRKCKAIEKHRPAQSGSLKNHHSQDISIGNHTLQGKHFIIDTSNKEFNFKMYPNLKNQLETAEGLEWIPSFDFTFSTIQKIEKQLDSDVPNQVKKKNRRQQENSTVSPEINEKEPSFHGENQEPSLTAIAKKQAQAALENQERKRRLKETRISKQIAPLAPEPTSNIIPSKETPTIYLSTKGMTIFNKLWQKNSGALNSQNDFLDPYDYRNDVEITKDEVKKLIKELGGEYHEEQGKGSHGKGDIPSLCNSPKIIFGNSTMTFADFGPSSQVVTLTKSSVLKFYQVIQLRNKLNILRYTPKTVKGKEST